MSAAGLDITWNPPTMRYSLRRFASLIAITFCVASLSITSSASAVEGTELNGSIGLWGVFLPDANDSTSSASGDSIGTIMSLAGHHRFSGYRTSAEGGITYGVTDDVQMLGYEALLRDTWSFGQHDLSAGFGYSQMDWDQDFGQGELSTTYQGAKVVAGWETFFGHRPMWLDFSLGLYDLDGEYDNAGVIEGTVGGFTTTYGLELKTEGTIGNVATRTIFGIDYLSDITSLHDGVVGTDDGLTLSAVFEFRLF